MKYYLIFIMNLADGKEDKAVYAYNSLDEARANFHKQLGGWMQKDNVEHILAMVINSDGGVYCSETYTKPAPIVDPVDDKPAFTEE